MTTRRWQALAGLLLFVVGTLGAPALDALCFDHHRHEAVSHVEAARADAHGERCVLETLEIPVTPADPPVACGRFEAALVRADVRAPHSPPPTRIDTGPLGSRAPPARA